MGLRIRFIYLILLVCLIPKVWGQEVVVYGYHHMPPYTLTDAQPESSGLNREFVALLNQSDLGIKFTYKLIKRPQLNRILENDESALVIWANPIWFEKDKLPRYLWSKAIFWDTDNIISLKQRNLEYRTPASLKGLRLGGNKGYFYKGINKLVKQGAIERIDATGDRQNIQRLLESEIDAAVMSRSSYFNIRRQVPEYEQLSISSIPHSAFYRHILVTKDNKTLLEPLNQWLSKLPSNKRWQQLIKYHFLRQSDQ